VVAPYQSFISCFGTPWGLFRHYWVVAKLLLTIFATVVLLKKMPLIGYAAHRAAETPLPTAALRATGFPLLVHGVGGILVLLVITALSVYKPWGLTLYGRRKQQERRKAPQEPDNNTPLGVKIFFAVIGVLVLVFIVLHLTGHGFESHGH